MDSHQLDLVPLSGPVRVGKQGYMGQVVLKGDLLTTGGLIFVDRLLQLR